MKRAALDLSLKELIGLILGAIIILIIIVFAIGAADIIKNKPEQAAIDSYYALITTIDDLVNKPPESQLRAYPTIKITPAQKNAVQVVIPLYLQGDYGVVGLDKDIIGQTCGPRNLNLELKSSPCTESPCICLIKLGYISVNNYELCSEIKGIKEIFVVKGKDEKEPYFNYGKARSEGSGALYNFVLWSECLRDPPFNVKNLKIAKIPNPKEGFDIMFQVLPPK